MPDDEEEEKSSRMDAAKAFFRAMYAGSGDEPAAGESAPAAAAAAPPPGDSRRVKELEQQVKDLEQRTLDAENLYKRMAADFDNFRRRMDREREDLSNAGIRKAAEFLIPALDDLDRAMLYLSPETPSEKIIESFKLVASRVVQCLEQAGLKRLHTMGVQFDPRFHEPVQQIETSEHPDGSIIHELRGGYILGDRVIRPALVNVASNNTLIVEPLTEPAPPPTNAEPANQQPAPEPAQEPAQEPVQEQVQDRTQAEAASLPESSKDAPSTTAPSGDGDVAIVEPPAPQGEQSGDNNPASAGDGFAIVDGAAPASGGFAIVDSPASTSGGFAIIDIPTQTGGQAAPGNKGGPPARQKLSGQYATGARPQSGQSTSGPRPAGGQFAADTRPAQSGQFAAGNQSQSGEQSSSGTNSGQFSAPGGQSAAGDPGHPPAKATEDTDSKPSSAEPEPKVYDLDLEDV